MNFGYIFIDAKLVGDTLRMDVVLAVISMSAISKSVNRNLRKVTADV